MSWQRALPLLLLGLLAQACAHLATPRCPVEPVPTRELPEEGRLRGRIRFDVDGESVRLEAVARWSAEELVVVGIAEYGVRVFAIRQRGREVEVADALRSEHEHLALWTLDALHRSLWIRRPPGSGSPAVISWIRESETVTESASGREWTRRFERRGASSAVTVHSRGGATRIENPWCGYRAVFVRTDGERGAGDAHG